MSILDTLTDSFKRFPGIGSRQARRFAYFLLNSPESFRNELAQQISGLSSEIKQCASCYRFFRKENGTTLCPTCIDPARDNTTLLVLEKDMDFENIHGMGAYSGRYFILGGSLPILSDDPARRIRIRQLLTRVESGASQGLKEIILAFGANAEGENTAQYVSKTLAPIAEKHTITITVLGKGLSTGTELEYSDSDTFVHALRNRR
ncbi:MAG: recombination protein RecR [Candidatus Yonathbacteria bacterium]|nr:recombination protein RecR [Candidatus Yonathbacteria bacterium]NTW47898.1 recombination protein RecR [Candidatus Yonathbacteria bacterium]